VPVERTLEEPWRRELSTDETPRVASGLLIDGDRSAKCASGVVRNLVRRLLEVRAL